MGDVDNHPDPVHFLNHGKAKRLQSLFHHLRLLAVRIADTVFIIPRQCDQADSHIIKSLHPFQLSMDHSTLFQCQKGGDLSILFVPVKVVSISCESNLIRIDPDLLFQIRGHPSDIFICLFVLRFSKKFHQRHKAGKKLCHGSSPLHFFYIYFQMVLFQILIRHIFGQ